MKKNIKNGFIWFILSDAFECDKVMCDNDLLFKSHFIMQVKSMSRLLSAFAFCLVLTAVSFAQSGFTIDNLIATKRVGDPQLSPDGKTVAFAVGNVNKAENKTLTHIYTVRIDGSNLKQITKGDASNSSPRSSSDGKRIAFTTGGQIWTMEPDGDDRKQVTHISTGAANPVWSPDGKWIAFNSDDYPECTSDDCNKAEDA